MVSEVYKQKISRLVLLAFLIIPVVIFTFFVLQKSLQDAVETGVVDRSCDLHSVTCEASFSNGGRLSFSIYPRPVKPLAQLDLSVHLSNISADQVEVDFQGIGIDMGFYRPVLEHQGDSLYSGKASLSVCTLDKMLWQATVVIKSGKEMMIAPFRFEVKQS